MDREFMYYQQSHRRSIIQKMDQANFDKYQPTVLAKLAAVTDGPVEEQQLRRAILNELVKQFDAKVPEIGLAGQTVWEICKRQFGTEGPTLVVYDDEVQFHYSFLSLNSGEVLLLLKDRDPVASLAEESLNMHLPN